MLLKEILVTKVDKIFGKQLEKSTWTAAEIMEIMLLTKSNSHYSYEDVFAFNLSDLKAALVSGDFIYLGETLAIVCSIKYYFFPILSISSAFLGSIHFLIHFISLNH